MVAPAEAAQRRVRPGALVAAGELAAAVELALADPAEPFVGEEVAGAALDAVAAACTAPEDFAVGGYEVGVLEDAEAEFAGEVHEAGAIGGTTLSGVSLAYLVHGVLGEFLERWLAGARQAEVAVPEPGEQTERVQDGFGRLNLRVANIAHQIQLELPRVDVSCKVGGGSRPLFEGPLGSIARCQEPRVMAALVLDMPASTGPADRFAGTGPEALVPVGRLIATGLVEHGREAGQGCDGVRR